MIENLENLNRTELAALLSAIAARILALPEEPAPAPRPARREPARWLSVSQVAARLGQDKRWVYRRCHRWDFVHREGRVLLFSEKGLEDHLERHRLDP